MDTEKKQLKDITTIVFDLGGVLVDWNPEYLFLKRFNGDAKKTKWFLENICTPEWNIMQDAGRSIAEANRLKIAAYPEYEADIIAFYEQWHLMFQGPIEGTLALFEAIKKSKNYRFYALTNWSAETWERGRSLFPFFDTFQGVVVSGQEKTIKPFTAIYNILFDRHAIDPKKAVFIDDNKQNTEAAIALGMHAIHFKNPTQLDFDLKALGVQY